MRFIYVFAHTVLEWRGDVRDWKAYLLAYEYPGALPDSEVRRRVREQLSSLYQNVRVGQKRIPTDTVVKAMMDYADDVGKPFWYDTDANVLDGIEIPDFFSRFLSIKLIERHLEEKKGWKFLR